MVYEYSSQDDEFPASASTENLLLETCEATERYGPPVTNRGGFSPSQPPVSGQIRQDRMFRNGSESTEDEANFTPESAEEEEEEEEEDDDDDDLFEELDDLWESTHGNEEWHTTQEDQDVGEVRVEPEPEDSAAGYTWPLTYRMVPPPSQAREEETDKPQQLYWSHRLHRSPAGKPPLVHYCTNKATSEIVAQRFLTKTVVGFDMEWKFPNTSEDVKTNASLIQVACEDEIALFHVALHEGETVEELLAPSLKLLIESPDIIKCGVAILTADGTRCERYLELNPQALMELSHMYKLEKYANTEPQKVNRSNVALATQVQEHLGLPLWKGPVRKSDWSKRLTADQIQYAADDAYAGFMLFKVLDAKREAMRPKPPRPAFAELRLPIRLADGSVGGRNSPAKRAVVSPGDDVLGIDEETTLLVEDTTLQAVPIDSEEFQQSQQMREPSSEDVISTADITIASTRKTPSPVCLRSQQQQDLHIHPIISDEDPARTKEIYDALLAHRRHIAKRLSIPPFIIASNDQLNSIAIQRCSSVAHLCTIRGIGKNKSEAYGTAWLRIVKTATFDPALDELDVAAGLEEVMEGDEEYQQASTSTDYGTPMPTDPVSEHGTQAIPRSIPTLDANPAQQAAEQVQQTRRIRAMLVAVRNQLAHRANLDPLAIVADEGLNDIAQSWVSDPGNLSATESGVQLKLVAEAHNVDVQLLLRNCVPVRLAEEDISQLVEGLERVELKEGGEVRERIVRRYAV